jgi:hypothetical protein
MAEDLLYRARTVLFEAADLLLELRQACAALARTLAENRRVRDGAFGPPWQHAPGGRSVVPPPLRRVRAAATSHPQGADPVTCGEGRPMTPEQFAELLRRDLARRGGHFDRGDVLRFLLSAWRDITADPDVARWAHEFLNTGLPDLGT